MYIDALKNAKKITVPKGHEPHLYEITPRIAKEMLDRHNARNPREKRDSYAKQYANDMALGQWTPGAPDMIVIDENGNIKNGQHRLMAVILSGTAQTFWVLEEAAEDIAECIDNGKPRRIVDYLPAGTPNYRIVSTLLQPGYAIEHGCGNTLSNIFCGRTSHNVSTTRRMALDFFGKNGDMLVRYASLGRKIANGRFDGSYANHFAKAIMLIDMLGRGDKLDLFVSHMASCTSTHMGCQVAFMRINRCKYDISWRSTNIKDLKRFVMLNLLTAYELFCNGDTDMTQNAAEKRFDDLGSTETEYNEYIANRRRTDWQNEQVPIK